MLFGVTPATDWSARAQRADLIRSVVFGKACAVGQSISIRGDPQTGAWPRALIRGPHPGGYTPARKSSRLGTYVHGF